MNVLAVGAHPDDVEILCSGTLGRFVAEGHAVTVAHASVGDKGHHTLPHGEVGSVRRGEARAAAHLIGAESRTLGFLDGEIVTSQENLRRVVDLIRVAQPELVITHHPDDYHGDHQAVTKLVLDASFMAGVPYFASAQPAHDATPPVYFMDTLSGLGFEPTDYVDIGDTIDLKRRAMSCHESQLAWLEEHHESDVLDMIDTFARFRGLQCGTRYAEGFRRLEAWGRITTRRLLP